MSRFSALCNQENPWFVFEASLISSAAIAEKAKPAFVMLFW